MKSKFDMRDKNIRWGVIGAATWFTLAIICLIITDRFLSQYPIWDNALHLFSGLFLGGMCATIALTQLYLDGKLQFTDKKDALAKVEGGGKMKQKSFTLIGLLIVIALLAGIAAVVFLNIDNFLQKQPTVKSWYQDEIIGQGILTNVEANGDMLLLSLQLMSGPIDNLTYITTVFCVDNDILAIQHMPPTPDIFVEPDYRDTKRFEVGTWYTLFRKTKPLHYLLLSPPEQHGFPVLAPTYAP